MRSRRLVAAVLAEAVIGWGCLPGFVLGAPSVAFAQAVTREPRDWAPVFAADFASPAVPKVCTAYDGQPTGQTAAYYRPDEVQVSGGMLRLSIRRRDFADRPYTAGGLGCIGLAQRYGRYEYRARVAPAEGVDSFVTLWPQDGSEGDATTLEIFAEQGRAGYLPRAHVSNAYGNGSNHKIVASAVDGFHDYAIEWAPSGLRVMIDNTLVFSDPKASGKFRWLGFAVSTGDAQAGGLPTNQDELPAEFLVDWIRVYTYQPGFNNQSSTNAGPAGSAGVGRDRADGSGRRGAGTVVLLLVAGAPVIIVAGFGLHSVFRRFDRGRSAHRA